jgi:DNA-binding NtrC family response regulator
LPDAAVPVVLPALAASLPRATAAAVPAGASPALRPLGEQVAELERAAIAQALRLHAGNRVQVARQLCMSRAALYDRLARWPDLLATPQS